MRNWADVPTGLIVDMLKEIGGDGHSIFPTEYFVKKWKIPEEVIKYNTEMDDLKTSLKYYQRKRKTEKINEITII